MSNRSQIDRKLIVQNALKNVIACVHFDVVFSGQSPLIDVTCGFCSGKFKFLQNYHLVEVFFAWRFRFFLARPGFQVSSVDFALMSF